MTTKTSSVGTVSKAERKPAATPKAIFFVLRDTFQKWQRDNCSRLAAAITYYTIFCMAPILIIALAVAGLVLGRQAAQGLLVDQVQGFVGPDAGRVVQGLIQNASHPTASVIATVISVITLILGASGLFGELEADLNLIWDVHMPQPKGFMGGVLAMVKDRLKDFALVLFCGVLLLLTFALGIAVASITNIVQSVWAAGSYYVLQGIVFGVSFVIMAIVFAVIYRVLPDTRITWGDVVIGALFTSLLFNIGRLLIGIYMGRATVGSAYGAAGSLIAMLVWINYSAQIFFLGAEFTAIYAGRHGSLVNRQTPQSAKST